MLADQAPRLSAERLHGAPALVIEVVSYSSKRTDRLQKRQLYLEDGVAEYWVVDPEARRIERWRPDDAEPQVVTDVLTWQPGAATLPLHIDLPGLFEVVAFVQR